MTNLPPASLNIIYLSKKTNPKVCKQGPTNSDMKWGFAQQSSVVRSNQKDLQYLNDLEFLLENELQSRFKILNTNISRQLTQLLYFILTTGRGQKTLGEEYCSLLQVDASSGNLLGLWKRLVYILSSIVTTDSVMKHRKLVSGLSSIYIGLFYFGLIPSYHLIKELLSFRYIYHPRRAPKAPANQSFRRLYIVLGVVSVAMGAIETLKAVQSGTKSRSSETKERVDASSACPLCLSRRQSSTRTPCGHLFCWDCICQWLSHKKQCPLCRKNATHADLLLIQNI